MYELIMEANGHLTIVESGMTLDWCNLFLSVKEAMNDAMGLNHKFSCELGFYA